jgi:hypothetical protein
MYMEEPGLPDFRKKILEDLDLSVQSVQKRAADLEALANNPAASEGASGDEARRLVKELWMLASSIAAEKEKWLKVLKMDYELSARVADERVRQTEASVRRLEAYASALEKEAQELKVERVSLETAAQDHRRENIRLKNELTRVLEFSKQAVVGEIKRVEDIRREAEQQIGQERDSLREMIEAVRKQADERDLELQKKLLTAGQTHEAALAAYRAQWAERESKFREELEAHWQKRLDEAVHGLQVVAAGKELEIGRLLHAQETASRAAESAAAELQAKIAKLRQELEDEHARAEAARGEASSKFAREKAALEEEWRRRSQQVNDEQLRLQAAAAMVRAERERLKAELGSVQQGQEELRRRADEAEARRKEAEARSREAEARLEKTSAEQEALVSELEHMRAAAADRESRLSELQARLERTESEKDSDGSELHAELETLRREKAEILARLEEIESRPQIEAAHAAAAASAADELSQLRASEADLKAKLAKAARASDSAAREKTQMELRLRAFEAELERVKRPAWKRWFAKPRAVAAPEEQPKKDPLGE